MIILGIDPGTASTGYAVLSFEKGKKPVLIETAVVSTNADELMQNRLNLLYKTLSEIAKKHIPTVMVVEKLFFNTNTKTAITVGQARGISLLVASRGKMDLFEYTALEAKLVLTGYGRSDKKVVQIAVKDCLKLKEVIRPDDACDAVAMVLCFLEKEHNPLYRAKVYAKKKK